MKQKIWSIIIIVLLIACNAQAQDVKQKGNCPSFIIGVTGGLSAASGNFVKSDYGNNRSGFAGSGYNIGVTATYFLTKNFGISALVGYSQFSFRGIQNIANGFHESFNVDSASAASKGNSHTINILAGPCYSLSLSKKFSVDFRALAGLTNATLAGWNVVLTDAGITHPPLTQNTATAGALGLQAGVGLCYNISQRWSCSLNADYFYSKPDFSIVNVDRNANAGREISEYHESISGINANLTLSYMLH